MNAVTGAEDPITARVEALDWAALNAELDTRGSVLVERLLDPQECFALTKLYPVDRLFRKRIVMSQHGFGRGEYRYFSYPLPDIIQRLRTAFYFHLAPIANRWNDAMGFKFHYPSKLGEFISWCHQAGQRRPTPLLLQYAVDGFNCLHQDLYGEHVFPIQITIQLNAPGEDFEGGQFVLTEQRPRMQSRVEVITLEQGDAVMFPVRYRPVKGARGFYRVNVRHGVSTIRAGNRCAAGIIFHDAT